MDKIAFKFVRQNLANQLNLPFNSELDIKILTEPDGFTDIKKKVLDQLGVPETQRNAIQIVDISYSIVCAYFQPIPDDDADNEDIDLTTSSLMDITPINMTTKTKEYDSFYSFFFLTYCYIPLFINGRKHKDTIII